MAWPLRVYSRYLLLDHAVRLTGHLPDQALYELIHAADVIAVPSVESTPWWPIEAAWIAARPVVATTEAAPLLLEHEHNGIVVPPNEKDLAMGIQRVLSDPELGRATADRGKAHVEERYCENKVMAQIQKAIGIQASA
jgi:glycosyltransferase involved in cell wall biosynthesis